MTSAQLKKCTLFLAGLLSILFLLSIALPPSAEAYISRTTSSGGAAYGISRSQHSGSSTPTPFLPSQPSQPGTPAPPSEPSEPAADPPQASPAPAPQQPSSQISGRGNYGIAYSSGYQSQSGTIFRTGPQPAPSPPASNPDPAPAPAPAPSSPAPPSSGGITLNQQEQQLLSLVNAERARRGLAPLQANSRLTHLARLKSQDMVDNSYFAHQSPVYGRVGDMLRSSGISFTLAAENLGIGGNINSIFNAFMNSPSHRSKIIDSRYTHTGVGIRYQPGRGYLVTQIFLLPR